MTEVALRRPCPWIDADNGFMQTVGTSPQFIIPTGAKTMSIQ